MQEGGKSEENIIEKIGSSKTQQVEGATNSKVTKNRIKREILKKLDLQPDKEKEVEDELIADDKSLDLYLQLLLERERRQVELLRESNLDRLNTIIDNCIKSDKFTKDSLGKVLEFTYKPQQDSSDRNHPIPQQRPAPPPVHLSPNTGKRKLASPLMSPMGHHKRFASDIPSLSTMTTMQSPYYGPTVQGGPAPWASRQYNQQPPQPQQQYEFKSTISAGLGGLTRQTAPLGENQPPPQPRTSISQQQQQQLFGGPYSPAQFPPGLPGPPSGYFLPTAPVTARTTAAQTGKSSHPAAVMASESPPHRAGSTYLQPPQHVGSSLYGSNTIKQEQSIPTRKFQGHRRSQSANVPTTHGTNSSSVKSPIKELHATPQKPVNFLIHTPKHPPPS